MTLLQVLKKFFVDDPIARTKKVYFWLYNFVVLRNPIFYLPYYYFWVLRPLRVGKDGRVGMNNLISGIVKGCVLRCEFCCSYSPYRRGFLSADELLESYAQWSKRIKPWYFFISGGEPLLHPELARILRESAAIWNNSNLWLTTNGLLLERIKPEVLQALKESGYNLIVTEHTFDPEHRKKLDAGYARLKQENIPFVVRPSRLTWVAIYQKKGNECIPFDSDPKKAWYSCIGRNNTVLLGNKLFLCGHMAFTNAVSQEGVLDAEVWKKALEYQPLTLESTQEEIVKHLRQREIPQCSVCPEKCVIISARQMPRKKTETTE